MIFHLSTKKAEDDLYLLYCFPLSELQDIPFLKIFQQHQVAEPKRWHLKYYLLLSHFQLLVSNHLNQLQSVSLYQQQPLRHHAIYLKICVPGQYNHSPFLLPLLCYKKGHLLFLVKILNPYLLKIIFELKRVTNIHYFLFRIILHPL